MDPMALVVLLLLVCVAATAGVNPALGRVIAGAFLYLVGIASVTPERADIAYLPAEFVAVSAGFVWLGAGLVGWGLWTAFRSRSDLVVHRLGVAAILLGGLALGLLLFGWRDLLTAASWRGLLAAAGLAGAGVVLFTLLSFARVGRAWKWMDEKWLTRWGQGTPALIPGRTRLKGASALVCFVIAFAVPHLIGAIAGTVVGVILLHDALRPSGKVPHWGLQPFILIVAFSLVAWFTWTIAGPELQLTPAGLAEAPFSEAAEMLLAPMIGLAAWALLGLWPLHGTGPASALSFLGGLFLIRWGVQIIPAGMAHLAPLAGIVAVLASFHATSLRRSGEYAVALGVLAVVPSGIAAWPFFVLGSVPATLWIVGRKSPVPGLDRHQLVGVALIPALAWALPTMLRGETVLTVGVVISGVMLFLSPKD